MQSSFSFKRWHVVLTAAFFIFIYSMTGCSKNTSPNNNKNDSDTVLHRNMHDSAKFYVTFDLLVAKTSGVFNDTFTDHASMIIYVVNGVVKVPHDSLRNFEPIVFPTSGTGGIYSAVWVPDNIGEINITDAAGLVADTTVAMFLTQTGTVTPKWTLTASGTSSTGGGTSVPGWPLAFSFSLKQQSQYPFRLDQPGSSFSIWCYKDY